MTKIKRKEAQKAQRVELKCGKLKIETARTCSINKGTGEIGVKVIWKQSGRSQQKEAKMISKHPV